MAGHKTDDSKTNDRHGWKRSDSKNIIRIDHSDVYIENERLGENLEFTMAHIHRSRYKQFLNRDSEIIQLKKSLAKMRQGSLGGSILNRTAIGKRDSRPRGPPETQSSSPRPTKSSPNTKGRHKKTSFQSQHTGRVGSSTPTPKVKKISINMPQVDKSATHSDASTDESDDDDHGDDDDDVMLHSDESDGDTPRRKPLSRPVTANINPRKKENKLLRSKSCTFEDPYSTSKRTFSLDALRRMLRLDNIPAAWYTTVVPASDVSFNRRGGRSTLHESTNPRNNRQAPSWEPRRIQSSRPGLKSENSPGEKRNHDSFAPRPHTSLGMSRTPDSKQATLIPSQDNSPRAGSRQGSRPVTATSPQNQKTSGLSSKTVRQLKEISEQDEQSINRPRTGVELMLDETREKQKILDHKINVFLKSLDELQKAKRWKEQGLNIQPVRSAQAFTNLTSYSSATVAGDILSRDTHETNSWQSLHPGSQNSTKLDDSLKRLTRRPTTAS